MLVAPAQGSTTGTGVRPLAERLAALRPLQRIPGRNATKADVVVYRDGARDIALKDYGPRPLLLRATVGRWLVRREAAAYRAAEGLPGLTRFLGRVGRYALAFEWIDARPLRALSPGSVAASSFDELDRILHGLHERGIALADLHHRDVLIGENGAVHVVDLATAWTLGPRPGRLRRYLFDRFREQDHIALARLRARFLGEDPEEAVLRVGARAAARHRRARRLKGWLNRLRGRRR